MKNTYATSYTNIGFVKNLLNHHGHSILNNVTKITIY